MRGTARKRAARSRRRSNPGAVKAFVFRQRSGRRLFVSARSSWQRASVSVCLSVYKVHRSHSFSPKTRWRLILPTNVHAHSSDVDETGSLPTQLGTMPRTLCLLNYSTSTYTLKQGWRVYRPRVFRQARDRVLLFFDNECIRLLALGCEGRDRSLFIKEKLKNDANSVESAKPFFHNYILIHLAEKKQKTKKKTGCS